MFYVLYRIKNILSTVTRQVYIAVFGKIEVIFVSQIVSMALRDCYAIKATFFPLTIVIPIKHGNVPDKYWHSDCDFLQNLFISIHVT